MIDILVNEVALMELPTLVDMLEGSTLALIVWVLDSNSVID